MVYIYLTRRDKSNVRIIGTINSSQQIHASRLTEWGHLGLSQADCSDLKMTLMNYVLEWEPWIESAESYKDLREKLLNRGIDAPPSNTPLHYFEPTQVPKATLVKLNKNKVMTRRTD